MITKTIIVLAIWYLIGAYTFYLSITKDEDLKVDDLPLLFAFSFLGLIGFIAYLALIKKEIVLFKKRK